MPTSLSQCELRHLRYFIAVAEDGSFTRAARRLNISQPPLSMQIRQLETMLGYELFERRPRVALTAAGTSFLPAARRLLAQLSDAADAARLAARGAEGQVLLGFASTAVFDVLPRVLAAFRQSRPKIAVRLRELHSAEFAEALRSGYVDAAISREPARDPEVTSTAVWREPILAVLPAPHPLARRKRLRLRDLSGESFVSFPRGAAPTLHDQIARACRAAGFGFEPVQEGNEWHTIVGLVAAGEGIALAPACVARMAWSGITYKSIVPPVPQATLHISRLVEPRGSAVQALVEAAASIGSASSARHSALKGASKRSAEKR